MSTPVFIALLAIVTALSAVLIASRKSGPKVTTIETRREEKSEDGE